MILGHIGVRKGSKGVPGKNFRRICGKPLIDWSLDLLVNCELIDLVVVSTDCPDIYQHSVNKGTLKMGLRPSNLATDTTAKWDVWQHSLCECERIAGSVTLFVDLDCTSPLRLLKDVENAIDLFWKTTPEPDMVMSCCEARKNPYFNLVEFDNGGTLRVSKPLTDTPVARQQAPRVYEHSGAVYVIAPNYLRSSDRLFEGRVIPYIMPPERCLDIDTELDFEIVERLLFQRILKN